jgi:hypothetical protein
MKKLSKILEIITVILLFLNAIIFLGTIASLLEQWVGSFIAYGLAFLAAPIFSPAFIFLPWFEAWVEEEPVSESILIIWGAFVVCVALRFVIERWTNNS